MFEWVTESSFIVLCLQAGVRSQATLDASGTEHTTFSRFVAICEVYDRDGWKDKPRTGKTRPDVFGRGGFSDEDTAQLIADAGFGGVNHRGLGRLAHLAMAHEDVRKAWTELFQIWNDFVDEEARNGMSAEVAEAGLYDY